jgi:hypothetical protein
VAECRVASKKASFDRWKHLEALREAGLVVICWAPDDMPGKTEDERQSQLDEIAESLEDRSVERGWEVIETLLEEDEGE